MPKGMPWLNELLFPVLVEIESMVVEKFLEPVDGKARNRKS